MDELRVGLVGGSGFMGKAHSIAWATVPMYCWPAPVMPGHEAHVHFRTTTLS